MIVPAAPSREPSASAKMRPPSATIAGQHHHERADSRSATRVMPNGAGQPPNGIGGSRRRGPREQRSRAASRAARDSNERALRAAPGRRRRPAAMNGHDRDRQDHRQATSQCFIAGPPRGPARPSLGAHPVLEIGCGARAHSTRRSHQAERDHDRGQHQRLRHRVGSSAAGRPSHDGRPGRDEPAHGEHEQLAAWPSRSRPSSIRRGLRAHEQVDRRRLPP